MGEHRLAALFHQVGEKLAVLGEANAIGGGAEHAHATFFEHAIALKLHRKVEAGLPAHGGYQTVGHLFAYDFGHALDGERLDVDAVGGGGVGLDGGRVGVDQHDLHTLFATS